MANESKFCLFKLSYLKQEVTQAQIASRNFSESQIKHHGEVNGMILVSQTNFFSVEGYDEFYHFYGSEDIDLYERLINNGMEVCKNSATLFFHQWHPRYPQKKDRLLTQTPRLWNVLRLNQQHYWGSLSGSHRGNLYRISKLAPFPFGGAYRTSSPGFIAERITPQQKPVTTYYTIKDLERLQKPSIQIKLPNIAAVVQHFLEVELPGYADEIVSVAFYEDPYYRILKHRVKKCLG